MNDKLLYEEESYKVIGSCLKVHKSLGNGFSEEVYHEALARELAKAGVPYEQGKKLDVFYDGVRLSNFFTADFVCFGKIIVEIRSIHALDESVKRQIINYLRSTRVEVGLLVNFGENSLCWQRFINTPPAE